MSKTKPTAAEIDASMKQYAVLWKPSALPEGSGPTQLAQHRATLQRALDDANRIKTNCHDCLHFSMDTCSLHGDVPQEFQKQEGQCETWQYDAIPF